MPWDTGLPYGLRDSRLTPYTDQGGSVLGTSADNPVARSISFSEAEDFEELRGDDKVVALRGKGASVDWEMENGGIALSQYKVMAGGVVTTSGTTPAQVTTFKKKVTDAKPYFQAEGQAISDQGGDFHVVLYKCRASDSLEGELADGTFWLTKASGSCLPATITGEEDTLYDFILNETVTAIT
jgi:hypothetical protein